MSLKKHFIKGSFWNFIGTGSQQILALFFFVYLARKLAPADFGIIAIATVLLDIAVMLARCGLTEALQQEKHLSESRASTGFWLLQAAGLALTVVLVVASPFFASVFSMPELEKVMWFMAPVCLIQTLSSAHEANLQREFGFRALGLRNVLASLAGGLVSVTLAYQGMGYYSLVAQRIVFSSGLTLGVWIGSSWRPSFVFDKTDARQLLNRGGHIVGTQLASLLTSRIVDIFTGFFFGSTVLGYVRIGYRMIEFMTQIVLQPVSGVTLPIFNRLQSDIPRLHQGLLQIAQVSSFILLPMFIGFSVVAEDLTVIVFGESWRQSSHFAMLFGIGAAAWSMVYYFTGVMFATHHNKVVMHNSLNQLLAGAALGGLGALISPMALVAANTLRSIWGTISSIYLIHKHLQLPLRQFLQVQLPPLLAVTVMASAVFILQHTLWISLQPLWRLCFSVGTGALVYAASIVFVTPTYWQGLKLIANDLSRGILNRFQRVLTG